MSIKLLAEDDRPREKFLKKGKEALSDSELLAIILGSGNSEESAISLAQKIMAAAGNNWHKLSLFSVKDLMKFKGVGPVKATEMATALEIGKRRALQEIPEKQIIKTPADAAKMLLPILSDLPTEEFRAIFLSQNGAVLHHCRLSSGGINSSLVDIRILFKTALEWYATSLIVAHNHPSGALEPGSDDLAVTKAIAAAGKILDIELIDHLIISQAGYFSFKDKNML